MSTTPDTLEADLRPVLIAFYRHYGDWDVVIRVVKAVMFRMADEEEGAAPQSGDDAPDSAPYELTERQRNEVRLGLFNLYERWSSWPYVAEKTGYPERFIHAFIKKQAMGSRHLAAVVAHALHIDVEFLLSGEALP